LEGGMFKWISLSIVGVVLAGLFITNGYLSQVIASKNRDNTAYLIAEYKAKPTSTASTIRSKTALCVTEQVGQNIPGLNKLFGEIVLYTIKNIDKNESAFYQGYMQMMSKQERLVMSLLNEASPAKEKAINQMVKDSMEKPFKLLGCVASKMKTPTKA
jgi:hypothetical protein